MVGGVEGIPAELEGLSFPQSPVLHDRCINAKNAWSEVSVLAGVAETAPIRRVVVAGDGIGKGGLVEVTCFFPIPVAALSYVEGLARDRIGAVIPHADARVGIPRANREWAALLPGDNAAQLPAADRFFHQLALFLERGSLIDEVADPGPRNVRAGVAAVPLGADRIAQRRIAVRDVAGAGDVDGMRPLETGTVGRATDVDPG